MYTASLLRHQNHAASFLTVIKLEHLVVDGRGHADGLAGEVWVVVESLSHCHSCWGFAVSCQQAEHIVLSSMSEGDGEIQQVTTNDMQISANFVAFIPNCRLSGFQELPGIDNVAEVWRQGSVVGNPGCLGVGVGLWEVV